MTVEEVVKVTTERFKSSGIESARLDAEIIIAHVLNVDKYRLITENRNIIGKDKLENLEQLVKRRLKREPVAYILQRKEFYSLNFKVTPDVLIPRPETELLVDLAVYYAPQDSAVLDLCTGSGIIAVALKYNRRDLLLTASDISQNALEIAKENAHDLLPDMKIDFIQSDLFENIPDQKYSLIVTNPPYVNPDLKEELSRELDYEPEDALYADNNGKSVIEKIITNSPQYLSKNGRILMEVGSEMSSFIENIADKNGFKVSILKDYANKPRVANFLKQ